MQVKCLILMTMEDTSKSPLRFLRQRLSNSFILKRLDSNASCLQNDTGSYNIILRYDLPTSIKEMKSVNRLLEDLKKMSRDFFLKIER